MTRDTDTARGDTRAEPDIDTPRPADTPHATPSGDTGITAADTTLPAGDTQPKCWCAYGGDGLESIHPQCPQHGTEPTPATDDRELEPCEICADGPQDCTSCDGTGEDCGGYDCMACYGSGECVPDHCCACGGSPYCNCCSKCGAPCAADCDCPIVVQLHDGATLTV
jgi:hypothetical protein